MSFIDCQKWRGSVWRCPWLGALLFVVVVAGWITAAITSAQSKPESPQSEPPSPPSFTARVVLDRYCVTCHNARARVGGLALDTLDGAHPGADPEVWERVIRKLRTRTMPPGGVPRPSEAEYQALVGLLESELDRAWAAAPNPGRINAVHRLNRTEYSNAIRDLLGIDLDVRGLLPGDETADGGFDNVADVLSITTAHLERYLAVARHVTRVATGLPPPTPRLEKFEVSLHVVQEDRLSEDLPFGSRGGIAVRYQFPANGDYLFRVSLRRQYQDYLMGMGWPQQLEIRLDGKLLRRFTVGGGATQYRPVAASYAGDGGGVGTFGDPAWEEYMQVTGDKGLEVRVPVEAGSRVVSASFVQERWEPEGLPQPVQRGRTLTNDEIYMGYSAISSLEVGGPFEIRDSAQDSPRRREIFVCVPQRVVEEDACAGQILGRMARRAYRQPVSQRDIDGLLAFYRERRARGDDFDAGIQFALERLLVDPRFLLRVYRDPARAEAAGAYRLSDLEVASRLSFFLWGSIPDDALLTAAEQRQLTRPEVLEAQVRRMLADERAIASLVHGFAAQWLNLRRVSEVLVHPDYYPDFDDNLLQAFEQETVLFVGSTVREDRSVLDLLRADYTFVNERLAKHYGIPGVYGSRYRRVTLPDLERRGGLLAHGGLLAASSYPDRTSPVLRGKWLLDNILGSPPPAPPADVDTSLMEEETAPGSRPPSIRERLARHRTNAACSTCHSMIDPLGFALENFDVIGGWRTTDERGNPVDVAGRLPNGREIGGFSALRAILLDPPEPFVHTVVEKLLAYALGRRLEYYDQPAVRQIVRGAAPDYRWSSILLGIARSPAFLMRAVRRRTEGHGISARRHEKVRWDAEGRHDGDVDSATAVTTDGAARRRDGTGVAVSGGDDAGGIRAGSAAG